MMRDEIGTNGSLTTSETPITSLVPRPSHPFYVVSPPYSRISAGVTVLHLLCHYLNMSGESAFMVTWPPRRTPLRSLPYYVSLQTQEDFPAGLQVPSVTQDVFAFYDERELTPIVIYPEVYDNLLKASFFGRYILNYPGKLAPAYRGREDFSLAYSKTLADDCTKTYPDHPRVDDILYVPTSDLTYWNARGAAERRQGACYYAGKLQGVHGKAPANVPQGATEILRSDKMSRDQVRALFWKSETFYCYEDSALATEAMLCGCPTAFVPNEYFSGTPLAANELGTDGWWTGHEPHGLDRARTTVHNVESRVQSYMVSIPERIGVLGRKWKEMVRERKYERPLYYPFEPRLVYFEQKVAASPVLSGEYIVKSAEQPAENRRSVTSAQRLIMDTLRNRGVRGVIRLLVRGWRRHGPVGFLKLLAGMPVKSH